jgi:tetratricopeptide (TPR) repeat protein
VLAERESVELLRTLIGERVTAAPDAAGDLADRCAHLPLALRIAAELSVGRPDASLADLVTEVADESRRIEVLATGNDGRTSVRAVFSWSYRHLPASAARAFRLVGACPGRDVPIDTAAVLLGAPVDEARRELGLLARAHLVQLTGAGRYCMHDLLRAYARELADGEEPEPDRRAALDRLFAHDLSCVGAANRVMFAEQRGVAEPAGVAFADAARARAWLDGERSNLVAAVGHMAEHGWSERSLLLATALWRYLDGCAHYADAFTVNTFALGAARRIGDRVAEGGALHNLGRVYWLWGRSDEACAHLVEALGVRRETGDRSGEGRTLGSLGTLHWRWGHYDEALDYYRQALAIRRETGDRAGEAIALGNLGIVYEAQGRYDQALDQYHAAIAIHDEVGDAEGRGRTLSNIGVVHQGRGEYDKAVEFHERALATARQVGDRLCELTVLGNLGIVFAKWGRHDDALEHYERALRIARDIGDREGEAEIENNAAIVHRERGDCPAAIEHHRRGLTIAREIGDRRAEASCLNGLGEALRACGQRAESAATHREALGLAKEIGDRFQQARALDGQAHERDASGDHSRAHQLWTAALELYTELGVPEADEVRRNCHAASTA